MLLTLNQIHCQVAYFGSKIVILIVTGKQNATPAQFEKLRANGKLPTTDSGALAGTLQRGPFTLPVVLIVSRVVSTWCVVVVVTVVTVVTILSCCGWKKYLVTDGANMVFKARIAALEAGTGFG